MQTIRGCGYETYERGNDPSFRPVPDIPPEVEDIVLKIRINIKPIDINQPMKWWKP